LHNRTQRVIVNGETSNWYEVSSGVPQGSVLGLLLFIIYVNDIPDLVCSTTQMAADDIKTYAAILTSNDSLKLQHYLAAWSKDWLLEFNLAKCKVMRIGRSLSTSYYLGESD